MTLTEREVLEWKLGHKVSDDEIVALTPKRYRKGRIEQINQSKAKYKFCDICDRPFCINNYPDGKSRTPRMYRFVICADCDPRHPDDRWLEKPRILHRHKLRIVRFAQITRALTVRPCSKKGEMPCKCPECTAGKLMPPF